MKIHGKISTLFANVYRHYIHIVNICRRWPQICIIGDETVIEKNIQQQQHIHIKCSKTRNINCQKVYNIFYLFIYICTWNVIIIDFFVFFFLFSSCSSFFIKSEKKKNILLMMIQFWKDGYGNIEFYFCIKSGYKDF